jgi:glyoxylase-like metal-dependent hydrolase (beta-lactamase superfamily II)
VLRSILAPNASALTLDGTRTWLVGTDRVVIIDPGSNRSSHLEAVTRAVGDADVTAVVVTHGHPDHLAGASELAADAGSPLRMSRHGNLADGDRLETDAGYLIALATPGHTPDHVSLHWPAGRAVFCGDLMMGGQDTALVAAPEGRLGAYLASLERIRRLDPAVIHPAHGPSFEDPSAAIDGYRRHREQRLAQVMGALEAGATGYDELLAAVYGRDLAQELERPAMTALKAYIEHLHAGGRIRRRGRGWDIVPG